MSKIDTNAIPDATRDRDGDGLPDWWEAQINSFRWSYQTNATNFNPNSTGSVTTE